MEKINPSWLMIIPSPVLPLRIVHFRREDYENEIANTT